MASVPLLSLNPRWVGSGGDGVRQPSDRLCAFCGGEKCEVCHQTGKEYEPAPERRGVALSFDCPCATCAAQRTGDDRADFCRRVVVHVDPPLDGGPPLGDAEHRWQRSGDTFETLVLRPSILDKGRCGWHGFVGGAAGDAPGMVETV